MSDELPELSEPERARELIEGLLGETRFVAVIWNEGDEWPKVIEESSSVFESLGMLDRGLDYLRAVAAIPLPDELEDD